MPKGKSSARAQQQAGAAAVRTTRAPQSPDAAAYHSFTSAIRMALKQNGMGPSQLQIVLGFVEQLREACCSYDGTLASRATIQNHIKAACFHAVSGTNAQHFLVCLLLRRTLLASNMHTAILNFLKDQQSCSEDIIECFLTIHIIIDGLPHHLQKSLPKECLPPPSQSTEALAPSFWHPKIIALALKALLACKSRDRGHPTIRCQALPPPRPTASSCSDGLVGNFLSKLEGAALSLLQCGQQEGVASIRASAHTVLSDQECMDLVWKVLQRPDHAGHAVSVLRALVAAADPPPGGPGSLSHLLRTGAAQPLAAALSHFTKGATKQSMMQLVHQQPTMPTPDQPYPLAVNSVERLLRLIPTIQKAAMHDWPLEAGPDQRSPEHLTPWPEELVEAFILGVIKGIELDAHTAPGFDAPAFIPMHLILLPPPSSNPALVRVLSRHPASLSLLIRCIGRSAARLSITECMVDDCCAGFEFIASLLESTDSTTFKQHLPELYTCITAVASQVEKGSVSEFKGVEVARASARLARQVSKLMGVRHIPGYDADLMEKCEARLAGYSARKGALGSAPASVRHDGSRARASYVCVSGNEAHFCLVEPAGVGVGAGSRAGGSSSSSSSMGSRSSELRSTKSAAPKAASPTSGSCRECAYCGRMGGELKACGRCRSAWYCGSECQRGGWASHRRVCKPQGA